MIGAFIVGCIVGLVAGVGFCILADRCDQAIAEALGEPGGFGP